jgi:hypothetical protein
MQTLAVRSDGTSKICMTLEDLDRFLAEKGPSDAP